MLVRIPQIPRVLSVFNLGPNLTIDSRDDGAFTRDLANVTIIAYMLPAAGIGKDIMRIPSDDTDVFVMLVYLGLENIIAL